MGIYDRDYFRDDEGSWSSSWSMIAKLIAITAAVYVLQLFTGQKDPVTRITTSTIEENFHLEQQWFRQPWKVFQLLTYGFLHSPDDIQHILFNMFGVWFFGAKLELVYGGRQFLRIYLSAIIFSGLFWCIAEMVQDSGKNHGAIGASGGVMALVALYALNFPNDLIYVFGFIPARAWAVCAMYIALDVLGVVHSSREVGSAPVAHSAHLGGALAGYIFYRTRYTFFSLLPDRWSWNELRRKFRRSPKLRVHDEGNGEPEREHLTTKDLQTRMDEILAKITRSGESSLTPDERRTLEEASRRYQERRK